MGIARRIFLVEIIPTTGVAIDFTLTLGPWWAFMFLLTLRCIIGAVKGR